MARNQVVVLHDVSEEVYDPAHRLHFQWCRFDIEQDSQYGYRFMWSRHGRLLPLRGGARIPSADLMQRLVKQAQAAGWGGLDEATA